MSGTTEDETVDGAFANRIDDLSLAEKVGQLFQVGFHGTEPTESIRELIADYHVGGVIYFARNVETASQTAALSAALQDHATETSGIPLLIAADQEGGTSTRVPFGAVPPSNMALGATGSESLAREFGEAVGRQISALGINFDLAPVLDVNNNPDNPVIGPRSFGADPALVSDFGVAVTEGLQSAGIAACGKHFPGHGDTAVDSHEAMPVIDHGRDRLDRVELRPFRAAIDAGIDAVMSSHVFFPEIVADDDIPATLSEPVLTGLLRDELGYDGLVATDCLEMNAISDGVGTAEGAVQAVAAGADIVYVSHTPKRQRAAVEAVVDAVRAGDIPEDQIDDSAERVLRLKDRVVAPSETPSVDAALEGVEAMSARVATEAVTLVRDDADRIPVAEDADLFVWDFPAQRRSEAAEAVAYVDALVDHLSDSGYTVRRHSFADGERDLPAVENEVVLVCARNAANGADQRAVVEQAEAAGHRVVTLAMTNPYDARALPDARTLLTTYDDSPSMLEAAGDVITGQIDARGDLPVELD